MVTSYDTVLTQRRDLRQQRAMAFAGYESLSDALADRNLTAPPPEDFAVMLSNHGEMFQLNLVGAYVWEKIDGTRSVGEIVDLVHATFRVDWERAKSDVTSLINRLDELGLVLSAERES